MVREIINKHNALVVESINIFNDLKAIIKSLDSIGKLDRLKIIISDIDTCIEYGYYYLNDEELYNPNIFRFDSTIIKFTDSILNDDSFGLLSEQKNVCCRKLIVCAEKLIEVNNELRIN